MVLNTAKGNMGQQPAHAWADAGYRIEMAMPAGFEKARTKMDYCKRKWIAAPPKG